MFTGTIISVLRLIFQSPSDLEVSGAMKMMFAGFVTISSGVHYFHFMALPRAFLTQAGRWLTTRI